jgi:outer membrane lipoprotein-sorting protein
MKTHSLFAGFATVVLFALPVALAAQAKTGPGYDPKAKTILDGVSATAKAYQSITATFSIIMEKPAPDKTKETKDGTVILKGNMYKIILENKHKDKVYHEEYYNDGKSLWVYSEKDKETTLDAAPDPAKKKNENQISPTEIFTIHEKGFKYTFIEEKTEGGKVIQIIDLIPEQPDKKNYHTIRVTIDKAKKQIISILQKNKDGSKTTYLVKTFTPNIAYTDATFKYDKAAHPGVPVIDLREDE